MTNKIIGFDFKLNEKMAEKGITQADLCRLTGLASSMISHYCAGQRIPSIPVAIKIAEALDVTVDYLVHGEASPMNEIPSGTLTIAEETIPYSTTLTPKHDNSEETMTIKFRQLNGAGQAKVVSYIEDLLSSRKYK